MMILKTYELENTFETDKDFPLENKEKVDGQDILHFELQFQSDFPRF
mgnify:CR=1 FL=1